MRQRIPFRCIDVGAAAELLQRDGVCRFDVRSATSFATSHIDQAEHVTQAKLPALIAGTAKSTPILIYCYHGHASQEYAQTFSDFGFVEVYSLDGGYEAWSQWERAIAATPPDQALERWLSEQGFPSDDINAAIANATTPLMKAAHLGHGTVVRDLLAAGARLEAKNADGNNALWLACVGDHLDVIDLLVEAGVDIDNRNLNGATVLMYAASSGKAAVVAQLLAHGGGNAGRIHGARHGSIRGVPRAASPCPAPEFEDMTIDEIIESVAPPRPESGS